MALVWIAESLTMHNGFRMKALDQVAQLLSEDSVTGKGRADYSEFKRDMLKHLLGEQGLAAADLSRLLGGSRNVGAMIPRGERKLRLYHVRTLARHFGVSADVFLT